MTPVFFWGGGSVTTFLYAYCSTEIPKKIKIYIKGRDKDQQYVLLFNNFMTFHNIT